MYALQDFMENWSLKYKVDSSIKLLFRVVNPPDN